MGREDELKLARRAVADGNNTLILGPRGGGRTSFLSVLRHSMLDEDLTWLTVAGDGTNSPAELLLLLLQRFPGEREGGRIISPAAQEAATMIQRTNGVMLPAVTAACLEVLATEVAGRRDRIVIAIDSAPPNVAHSLFGLFRNDVWDVRCTWILTGLDSERELFLQPPADAFWDTRIALPPLRGKDLETLLERRRITTIQAIGDLERDAAGSITRALRLATTPRTAAPESSSTSLDAQGTTEAVLHWVDTNGSAWAGDPVMLEQIGISRSRAHQILARLCDSGQLVATGRRPAGSPGRARRVYTFPSDEQP